MRKFYPPPPGRQGHVAQHGQDAVAQQQVTAAFHDPGATDPPTQGTGFAACT